MRKIIVSFDYSITSPAMTIYDGEIYESHYLTNIKKAQFPSSKDKYKFIPHLYPIWNFPQERYEKISETFISVLKEKNILDSETMFLIEDYSFGSTGRVFHIAENTELIKYKIWKGSGQEMIQIPPKTIKKIFSGNGNSNKDKMAEFFLETNSFYIHDIIGGKIDGPANDIIDSIALSIVGSKIDSGEVLLSDIFAKKKPKKKKKLLVDLIST